MATIEKKIWAVSEAYSMQPYRYVVGETFNPTNKGLLAHQMAVISRIEIEETSFQSSNHTLESYLYVVGYDANNNRLFTFQRNSVNLYYFQELQNA